MTMLWAVLGYLVAGIVFLVVFQLATHRVGKRLRDVSADVQTRLMNQGATMVGVKTAIVLTLIYAWVAWVVVLAGYLVDERGRRRENR